MNILSKYGALALTMAGLAVCTPAAAATIVTPVSSGVFDSGNPIGTILGMRLKIGNTYDFTFELGGRFDVIMQMQAAIFGQPVGFTAQPIDFTLFAGTPGSGTAIATSPYMTGSALEAVLAAGSYYLEVGTIAKDMELISGSLTLHEVPEPAVWVLMITGFGLAGSALRRRKRPQGA